MENIYVIGHRNPDTDSIVSAIAYAALRNSLGDRRYVPARLGVVSDETQLVLDQFGFEAPTYLHTLRTQVKDLNFDTPPVLSGAVTIHHAWTLMEQSRTKVVAFPVTSENGKLIGMLTWGDIAEYDIRSIASPVVKDVPLFNLLSTLDGQLVNDTDVMDDISGELLIALPQSYNAEKNIKKSTILLCGKQPDVIRCAIKAEAACIIVCEAEIEEEFKKLKGKTRIISTPFDAYKAARMIYQAVPVSRVCRTTDLISFRAENYLDDVREVALQTRYRSYPILDENDMVLGTLSRYHLLRPNRKQVVLVDHNELSQSVHGLEQAEILEIVDHHRLADVQTGSPIYFRNEPVGSTCTIITGMYQESGIVPNDKLAGLMAAAIVSDTLMFKSPTSTDKDRRMAERMAHIAGISLTELGKKMFSVSANATRSAKELLFTDFKEFQIAGHFVGIGQITCLGLEELEPKMDGLLEVMAKEQAERKYDLMLFMLTDVLHEGTQLLCVGDEKIVMQAFDVEVKHNAVFLPGVISRKKQVVPCLAALWG